MTGPVSEYSETMDRIKERLERVQARIFRTDEKYNTLLQLHEEYRKKHTEYKALLEEILKETERRTKPVHTPAQG